MRKCGAGERVNRWGSVRGGVNDEEVWGGGKSKQVGKCEGGRVNVWESVGGGE
jgi:hypothetical protein